MTMTADELPDDLNALKAMVLSRELERQAAPDHQGISSAIASAAALRPFPRSASPRARRSRTGRGRWLGR